MNSLSLSPWLKGPSKQSRLPKSDRKGLIWFTAIAGFFWLITPRIYGNFTNHLHKEDGIIFLSDALQNNNLLATYTGYLHIYPRIIAEIGALFPPEYFSLYIALVVSAIRFALFFLILVVVGPYAKNPVWAVAVAATVLFIGPGQQEVLGNITNLRWFLDIGATLALLGAFRSWKWGALGVFFLWGGVLSDPLALALAPIALWRLIVLKGSEKIVPLLYFPAFILHVLIIDTGARESALLTFFSMPVEFFSSIVVRVLTVPLIGETGATGMVIISSAAITAILTLIFFVVLLARMWRNVPTQARVMVFFLGAAALCFFIATINFTTMDAISVSSGVSKVSRYSLIPAVFVPAATLLVLSWADHSRLTKWMKVLTCLALISGSLLDSRGDEWSTRGPEWNQTIEDVRELCAHNPGIAQHRMQVTPAGTPIKWTADITCDWVKH